MLVHSFLAQAELTLVLCHKAEASISMLISPTFNNSESVFTLIFILNFVYVVLPLTTNHR